MSKNYFNLEEEKELLNYLTTKNTSIVNIFKLHFNII